MFNGNINSHTLKHKSVEIFINYILAAIINIIDFLIFIISWIPNVKEFINFIYRSPDTLEKKVHIVFGGSKGHRNFITHSVFNPIFIFYLFIASKICTLFSLTPLNIIVKPLFFIVGLCFTCHLLSDSMPKHWRGFANIKIYLFVNLFSFSPFISKVWLYIGSFLSVILLFKAILLV